MEFLMIWKIILRRKWIIIGIFFFFFATAVIGTRIVTPTYRVQALLLVENFNTLTSILTAMGLENVGGEVSSDDPDTNIALSKIKPLLKELISSLNLKNRKGKIIKPEKLTEWSLYNYISPQPYINVDQYEDSNLLEIVVTSPDPVEAANIANKLSGLYINDRIGRTRKEYELARLFIEQKIVKVKDEYDKSLSNMQDFKVRENTVNLDTETDELISKMVNLKSTYETIEGTIISLEKEIDKATEELKKTKTFRTESKSYARNEQFDTLRATLHTLLMSIDMATIDYTKEHPEYKKIEKKIDTAKDILKKETEFALDNETVSVDPMFDELTKSIITNNIDKEAALAKKKLIQKYLDAYEKALLELPEKYVKSAKLELPMLVSKGMYQNLLQYLTQIEIAQSMILSNIKLVETAEVPEKPKFPKKPINYLIGMFLGLFWGLATAFFIEYIDNTVKSPDDIKHIKSLNVLGTIPRTKFLERSKTIFKLAPNLPVVETFRAIKNSIRYASLDKPIKTIVITSSVEGEGKSSIASNIAIAFRMEGKRVLLVDLNFRRPSLHKFFDVMNNKGITNIYTEGLDLENVVIHTNDEGLDLLTSGPVPADPIRLIESQEIKEIISKVKDEHDLVIIDTPPVMAVNDAVIIGKAADGVLLVIESGKATFSMLEYVTEEMEKAGVNFLGTVLNKFKVQIFGDHRYYYRY